MLPCILVNKDFRSYFSYSYVQQTKLATFLVKFWAHEKIVFDWLIDWFKVVEMDRFEVMIVCVDMRSSERCNFDRNSYLFEVEFYGDDIYHPKLFIIGYLLWHSGTRLLKRPVVLVCLGCFRYLVGRFDGCAGDGKDQIRCVGQETAQVRSEFGRRKGRQWTVNKFP